MGCFLSHKWNGCKCEKCGKIRKEGHEWQGCKCTRCGTVRDEGHEWRQGIYCSRCKRLGNLDHFTPTAFATMPLPEFQRFLSSTSGLIALCSDKKKSFNLLSRFSKGGPDPKQEKELQQLLSVTQLLLNLYTSRALEESADRSQTYDDLLFRYTFRPEAHKGKFKQYGDMKAQTVLRDEMKYYLENV